jgi:23S rRNA (pseudouridine1915-N3)-methyltransferase
MLKIVAVGKMKDKRLEALLQDYLKRLQPMARLNIIEIKDSNPEKESREMVAKLGSPGGNTLVVAMDEHGDDLTSRQMAKLLGKSGSITFLIGGADGLTQETLQRCNLTVRLSSMTFTHEMARVLLAEQIYRGFSILNGKPYHRG